MISEHMDVVVFTHS